MFRCKFLQDQIYWIPIVLIFSATSVSLAVTLIVKLELVTIRSYVRKPATNWLLPTLIVFES